MDDEYLDSRGWSGCERLPFLEDPAVEQTLHKIETNIADPGARFNALRDWLVSAESFSYDLHEVEEVEERVGREIMRLLLQEHLDARGTGDVGPRIDVTTERKSWGSEETAEQEEESRQGTLPLLKRQERRPKRYRIVGPPTEITCRTSVRLM